MSSPEASPKRRKSTKPGYKYDWADIRAAFVEGVELDDSGERTFMNLVELADYKDIPVQRLRQRSSDEQWYELRQQYQLKLARTRQTKRILELSKESVDFDSRSLDLAKEGMALVTTRVSEIAREVRENEIRRQVLLEQGALPDEMTTVIDARELDVLARAASQWQSLGQKAMGTDVQRLEVQQNIDVDMEVTSISAELGRDDPERLAAFLQAAKRAGLLDTIEDTNTPAIEPVPEETDIVEAEIVDPAE